MPCTAVLAPILKKFVWIAPALLRIGAAAPRRSPPKPGRAYQQSYDVLYNQ